MNRILARHGSGAPSFGIWHNCADGQLLEISVAAGFDWVCLDLQHGLAEMADLPRLFPIIEKSGATKMVRLPSDLSEHIGRALDLGADGVIVPMISTPAQAAACAAACRYPPTGMRSCGPTRAMAYDAQYLQHADRSVMCVVMIETAQGVANAREIAAVPGIDALFVGPVDLSYSLAGGVQGLRTQVVADALDTILDAGKRAGKPVGIFGMNAQNARQQVDRGFDFCSIGTDVGLFTAALREARQSAGC